MGECSNLSVPQPRARRLPYPAAALALDAHVPSQLAKRRHRPLAWVLRATHLAPRVVPCSCALLASARAMHQPREDLRAPAPVVPHLTQRRWP